MKTFTLAALMLVSMVGHSFASGACGGSGSEKDSATITSSDESKKDDEKDLRSGD